MENAIQVPNFQCYEATPFKSPLDHAVLTHILVVRMYSIFQDSKEKDEEFYTPGITTELRPTLLALRCRDTKRIISDRLLKQSNHQVVFATCSLALHLDPAPAPVRVQTGNKSAQRVHIPTAKA